MQIGVEMHQIGSQPLDSITSLVTVAEQSVGNAKSKTQSPYQVVRQSTIHSADETNTNCGRQSELHKTM